MSRMDSISSHHLEVCWLSSWPQMVVVFFQSLNTGQRTLEPNEDEGHDKTNHHSEHCTNEKSVERRIR